MSHQAKFTLPILFLFVAAWGFWRVSTTPAPAEAPPAQTPLSTPAQKSATAGRASSEERSSTPARTVETPTEERESVLNLTPFLRAMKRQPLLWAPEPGAVIVSWGGRGQPLRTHVFFAEAGALFLRWDLDLQRHLYHRRDQAAPSSARGPSTKSWAGPERGQGLALLPLQLRMKNGRSDVYPGSFDADSFMRSKGQLKSSEKTSASAVQSHSWLEQLSGEQIRIYLQDAPCVLQRWTLDKTSGFTDFDILQDLRTPWCFNIFRGTVHAARYKGQDTGYFLTGSGHVIFTGKNQGEHVLLDEKRNPISFERQPNPRLRQMATNWILDLSLKAVEHPGAYPVIESTDLRALPYRRTTVAGFLWRQQVSWWKTHCSSEPSEAALTALRRKLDTGEPLLLKKNGCP